MTAIVIPFPGCAVRASFNPPTGRTASPPCAAATGTGTLPAGAAVPAGLSPGLRIGDRVLDYDSSTIGVAIFIEYGPTGAPSLVRVRLQHGDAWRRADRIERLFR